MNDAYQKMSELMDNWLSDSSKETKLALIEKEILLEKLRKLYVKIAAMEAEEYNAPQAAMPKPEPEMIPKREYTPAKTMEEDVDLFFDTEHESYAVVEKELKELAEEINGAQETPAEAPKAVVEKPEEVLPETDIFDKIETKEEPKPESEPEKMQDDAKELFIEPDFEINVSTEEPEVNHAEDDILQFIPPKQPKPEQPKVEKPKVEQPKPEQPKPEVKLDPKPQRSLNDLFNEKREDHSISSQYQHAKVGDLTKAISINDKFIYIKELFHNRGEDFSASIRLLNECQNLEDAFDCLEQLKQKFFWDTKTDAYLSFCDLLRRKYS
ncbi:MAG: hypothetical protein J6P54_07775 [Bacteroidales bacterium]|nr:hypothetical protein [Bacteroidales bacterium]